MLGGNLLLLLLLLFLPDISMLGYLKDKKIGSQIYNFVHNHLVGVIIIFIGITINEQLLILGGIALNAHVGLDRALGFGLKLPSSFKDTHLGKIGK